MSPVLTVDEVKMGVNYLNAELEKSTVDDCCKNTELRPSLIVAIENKVSVWIDAEVKKHDVQ